MTIDQSLLWDVGVVQFGDKPLSVVPIPGLAFSATGRQPAYSSNPCLCSLTPNDV